MIFKCVRVKMRVISDYLILKPKKRHQHLRALLIFKLRVVIQIEVVLNLLLVSLTYYTCLECCLPPLITGEEAVIQRDSRPHWILNQILTGLILIYIIVRIQFFVHALLCIAVKCLVIVILRPIKRITIINFELRSIKAWRSTHTIIVYETSLLFYPSLGTVSWINVANNLSS